MNTNNISSYSGIHGFASSNITNIANETDTMSNSSNTIQNNTVATITNNTVKVSNTIANNNTYHANVVQSASSLKSKIDTKA